jgi:hypothetical protein
MVAVEVWKSKVDDIGNPTHMATDTQAGIREPKRMNVTVHFDLRIRIRRPRSLAPTSEEKTSQRRMRSRYATPLYQKRIQKTQDLLKNLKQHTHLDQRNSTDGCENLAPANTQSDLYRKPHKKKYRSPGRMCWKTGCINGRSGL